VQKIAAAVALAIITMSSTCGFRPETGGERAAEHSPTRLAAGEQLVCRLGDTVECWGDNPFLFLDGPDAPSGSFQLDGTADDIAIGDHHACVLLDGAVSCWGSSLSGQLGTFQPDATCIDRPCADRPVAIAGLPRISSIAAGAFHTAALDEDGSVWCWGAASIGQSGLPVVPVTDGPRRIDGLPNATAVAAGSLQTYALADDGSVYAWGATDLGRLGIDTEATFVAQPTIVAGLSGPVAAVEVGTAHACALLKDGTVECWGDNRFGQLGDGTTVSRFQPAPVTGIDEAVTELAAGDAFTCAVTATGSVVCWGWNDSGQLGQGSFDGPAEPNGFSAALEPVPVSGLPGPATAIGAGSGFACVEVGGSTWCWGRNEAGQLGDATLDDRANAAEARPASGELAVFERPPAVESRKGLDVSYHTGRIDWDTLASGDLDFAFTLSTAGVDFHDPFFDAHWRRMKGLHRGTYHFFVAADDPAEQARWFIANTPLAPGDLAPVVDIEKLGADPPRDLARRLRTFSQIIEQHYGVKPIIYTGPKFWTENLGDGWSDHLLWIAEYQVENPTVPPGWDGWTLWQHQGDAKIVGVERMADLNLVAPGIDMTGLIIPVR